MATQKGVIKLAGATHAMIGAGASEIDFEAQSFHSTTERSGYFPLNHEEQAELILTLAIEFFQEVNGKMYPLNNGAYNALSLIKADKN